MDTNCAYDYVAVFDGGAVTNARFGMFYDRDDPPVIRSFRNLLTVHFVTDDWYQPDMTGFTANFTFGKKCLDLIVACKISQIK